MAASTHEAEAAFQAAAHCGAGAVGAATVVTADEDATTAAEAPASAAGAAPAATSAEGGGGYVLAPMAGRQSCRGGKVVADQSVTLSTQKSSPRPTPRHAPLFVGRTWNASAGASPQSCTRAGSGGRPAAKWASEPPRRNSEYCVAVNWRRSGGERRRRRGQWGGTRHRLRFTGAPYRGDLASHTPTLPPLPPLTRTASARPARTFTGGGRTEPPPRSTSK